MARPKTEGVKRMVARQCPCCRQSFDFPESENEPPGTEFNGQCPACKAALVCIRLPDVNGGWCVLTEKRYAEAAPYLSALLRQGPAQPAEVDEALPEFPALPPRVRG